ncbi:MAG: translesion error-prone DNA polymerase V autoproteolytic subunit [Acidobacteriota bacterium]|nr:translesion error-prone DNA polymerase V autoproteolytic subunit [Acidobacteriota bacterium]
MQTEVVQFYVPARELSRWSRPVFTCPVSAGEPLPVVEYIDGRIDLNRHLIKNYAATYFVRVSGDSMTGAGINDGDILVVDRSVEAADGRVVVACVNGEFLVKRLVERAGRVLLAPENDSYDELEINEHHDFEIWGVVTSVIHSL